MPITELALLHLKFSPLPQSTRTTLLQAQSAQSAYSAHPVDFFISPQDESYIYLLGGWESVETHVHDWIPSETNHEFMDVLKEAVEVLWMGHVDAEPGVVRSVLRLVGYAVDGGGEERKGSGFILRCFVAEDGGLSLRAFMHRLEETDPSFPFCGGSRIDGEDGKEEIVLFCGQRAASFLESEDLVAKGHCDKVVIQKVVEWRG